MKEEWLPAKAFLKALKPAPRVFIGDWADKIIRLTSEASKEAGPWRTARVPYTRAILEDLSPLSPVNEVVWCKGVQIAATTVGVVAMLAYVDMDPCAIMYVMPTEDMAESFSKTKLQPLIDNNEYLNTKIRSSRDRDSGNTILNKRFPGGSIKMAGANSPAALRSVSIRFLILDEVDAYPKNLRGEGSPVSIAEKRTASYGDQRKIYKPSTPTEEEYSVIWAEFLATDQRYYNVPCPHCSAIQPLEFEQLVWDSGKPYNVKYQCIHCDELIEERHKTRMMAAGTWIPSAPENSRPAKKGYHLNSLYSPYGWMSWDTIADEYEKAMRDMLKGDDALMRTFVNTIKGLPYKTEGEQPSWRALHERAGGYQQGVPPKDVCFLTAGVDVQKDRLEVQVVGWGTNKNSWSITHHVISGDTTKDGTVWPELAEFVERTWVREDGLVMPIALTAVDSGYNASEVYEFCKPYSINKLFPIKGQESLTVRIGAPTLVNKTEIGKTMGRLQRIPVGINILKEELYRWLRLKRTDDENFPKGYCHFPEYDENYFRGLTAEQLVTTWTRGMPISKWHRVFRQNEPLDTWIYARAAACKMGFDMYTDNQILEIAARYVPKSPTIPKKRERQLLDDDESVW